MRRFAISQVTLIARVELKFMRHSAKSTYRACFAANRTCKMIACSQRFYFQLFDCRGEKVSFCLLLLDFSILIEVEARWQCAEIGHQSGGRQEETQHRRAPSCCCCRYSEYHRMSITPSLTFTYMFTTLSLEVSAHRRRKTLRARHTNLNLLAIPA